MVGPQLCELTASGLKRARHDAGPVLGFLLVSFSEFMNLKLVGKTTLEVNIKFGLFLGHPLSK